MEGNINQPFPIYFGDDVPDSIIYQNFEAKSDSSSSSEFISGKSFGFNSNYNNLIYQNQPYGNNSSIPVFPPPINNAASVPNHAAVNLWSTQGQIPKINHIYQSVSPQILPLEDKAADNNEEHISKSDKSESIAPIYKKDLYSDQISSIKNKPSEKNPKNEIDLNPEEEKKQIKKDSIIVKTSSIGSSISRGQNNQVSPITGDHVDTLFLLSDNEQEILKNYSIFNNLSSNFITIFNDFSQKRSFCEKFCCRKPTVLSVLKKIKSTPIGENYPEQINYLRDYFPENFYKITYEKYSVIELCITCSLFEFEKKFGIIKYCKDYITLFKKINEVTYETFKILEEKKVNNRDEVINFFFNKTIANLIINLKNGQEEKA